MWSLVPCPSARTWCSVPTVPLLCLQMHRAAGDAGLTGESVEGSPWDREEMERYRHRWALPDVPCRELRVCLGVCTLMGELVNPTQLRSLGQRWGGEGVSWLCWGERGGSEHRRERWCGCDALGAGG